jgi:hypothetical protein
MPITSNIKGAQVIGAPPVARFKAVPAVGGGHAFVRVVPQAPPSALARELEYQQRIKPERTTVNTTAHLNRSKVKQTALEIASQIRPANKFARVGKSFLERIECKVRAAIREEVRLHPSKGVTLQ